MSEEHTITVRTLTETQIKTEYKTYTGTGAKRFMLNSQIPTNEVYNFPVQQTSEKWITK